MRLRDGSSPESVEETRRGLEEKLRDSIVAIKAALEERWAEGDAELSAGPMDPLVALDRLAELVKRSDSEALELFARLRATARELSGLEASERLFGLLSEYRFAEALPLVGDLRETARSTRAKGRPSS